MMEIFQIVSLGIIATSMIVILSNLRPEFIIFISIITGLIIFSLILNKLIYVIDIMKNLSMKANLEIEYFSTILKIIGMSYIVEFGSQICRDAGQSSIAMKVELAGKVSIVMIAIPVLVSLMDLIFKILP